jgi:quercetin dioxygenase-like cupin family protein
MKVLRVEDIKSTEREVKCPNGGFTSNRILLKSDGMGFGMTKTVIPPNGKQHWHYKNHLESCYCVSGYGILTDIKTGEEHEIVPDTTYVLDKNDDHYFEAIEEVVLICAFNPPLKGDEVHQADGSYSLGDECESLKKIARKHKPIKKYLRSFLEKYEEVFEPIRHDKLKVLEIGVGGYKAKEKGGGSLRMWAEYFTDAHIVGIDLNGKDIDLPSNASFFQGSQTDLDFLDRMVTEYGPFDVVIDDASHVTESTIASFNALWENTKQLYIIEDLHMKSAEGTKEYFMEMDGADFGVDHMCVIKKNSEEGGRGSSGFLSPVYDVKSVPITKVTANDYNPNSVAPPEMALLETSIWEDGYTQPVVTVYDRENDKYVVIDGFHRFLTLMNSERIKEREKGMLPVVVLDKEMGDRMASTIRHNRARGSHNIELMSTIVSELVEMGKGDRWICQHIGMSADELLRMKQITGVAALFANKDFSDSWTAEME